MTVHFYADAEGDGDISWQWQGLEPGGMWVDLTDGSGYSGTDGSALAVSFSDASLDGWHFRAIATNYCDSVTSGSALLTISVGTGA